MGKPTKRNPVARQLRDPRYRKQVMRPRRGKGSYRRSPSTARGPSAIGMER